MFCGQHLCKLFFMEQFDLSLYCWQYRLPKNISSTCLSSTEHEIFPAHKCLNAISKSKFLMVLCFNEQLKFYAQPS